MPKKSVLPVSTAGSVSTIVSPISTAPNAATPPVSASPAAPVLTTISFEERGQRLYLTLSNGTVQSFGLPNGLDEVIFGSSDPVAAVNALRSQFKA